LYLFILVFHLSDQKIKPTGPGYVLNLKKKYTASFAASVHPQRVSHGNVNARIYAKPINSATKSILVDQETFPWVYNNPIVILSGHAFSP